MPLVQVETSCDNRILNTQGHTCVVDPLDVFWWRHLYHLCLGLHAAPAISWATSWAISAMGLVRNLKTSDPPPYMNSMTCRKWSQVFRIIVQNKPQLNCERATIINWTKHEWPEPPLPKRNSHFILSAMQNYMRKDGSTYQIWLQNWWTPFVSTYLLSVNDEYIWQTSKNLNDSRGIWYIRSELFLNAREVVQITNLRTANDIVPR